jgi:uncharacterized protein (DUF302 family)
MRRAAAAGTGRPGLHKTVDQPFEDAIAAVTAALAREEFGVPSRVDVDAAFAEKLGIEYPRLVILGACNPRIAHSALTVEPDVAQLLPCGVVLREEGPGRTAVTLADPGIMAALFDDPELGAIAAEAARRLQRVLESL